MRLRLPHYFLKSSTEKLKKYTHLFYENGVDQEEMETGSVMCNFITWSAFPVVVVVVF